MLLIQIILHHTMDYSFFYTYLTICRHDGSNLLLSERHYMYRIGQYNFYFQFRFAYFRTILIQIILHHTTAPLSIHTSQSVDMTVPERHYNRALHVHVQDGPVIFTFGFDLHISRESLFLFGLDYFFYWTKVLCFSCIFNCLTLLYAI